MNKSTFLIAIATLMMVFSFGQTSQAQTAIELLQKFDASVDRYTKLQYTFNYKERVKGEIIVGDLDLFIEEGDKKKVHAKVRKPEEAKLWYREGEMRGKVMTHLGLGLPPLNKRFMKNGQHPIYRAGFMRTRDIIMDTYEARKEEITSALELKPDITFDGRTCYHIVINDDSYGTKKYRVKEGDNLLKIAEANAVPEMRILELNELSNYFDVEAGQEIIIPTAYASKTTLYIDKATYLPLYQKVEDDLGLLAEYKHLNLVINPEFPDRIFYRK